MMGGSGTALYHTCLNPTPRLTLALARPYQYPCLYPTYNLP